MNHVGCRMKYSTKKFCPFSRSSYEVEPLRLRPHFSLSLCLFFPLCKPFSFSLLLAAVTPVGKLTTNSERKDLQRVNLDFNEACLKRLLSLVPAPRNQPPPPVTNGQLLLIAADSAASGRDEKSCYALLPFFHCRPFASRGADRFPASRGTRCKALSLFIDLSFTLTWSLPYFLRISAFGKLN